MSSAPATRNTVDVPAPVGPRSIAFKQEDTRSTLAYVLVAILAIEVIAALTSVLCVKWLGAPPQGTASVKDILSVVFTPTVALVGSAVGFYFGNERKKETEP